MTTVVTGAAGHIGGVLIRKLIETGREVRAVVHNDTAALEGLDIQRVKADVTDIDSLKEAFQGAETVFHLAARISIVGSEGGLVEKINVRGPANVIAACQACGVRRLVHFSSIHAYSQSPLDEPLDETRPQVDPAKALAYDRSKAAGEREILKGIDRGQDAVIVNPTAVIGPMDFKPSRMGQVILDLADSKLPALVDGGFDWVDVRDVVDGAIAAESKGRIGEKYLLGGKYAKIATLAKAVEKATGVPAPKWACPMPLARFGAPFAEGWAKIAGTEPLFTRESLAALRANRNIIHEKAERELGYRTRPLDETIKDAVDWFRQAGKLEG